MSMYSAAAVANAFLQHGFSDESVISPMKIQKLLYFSHGYSLVELEEPLIDEVFEAWKFGPVLPSLYHECKNFGRGAIDRYLKDIDPDTGETRRAPIPRNENAKEIIDYVWSEYGGEKAMKLSNWTHVKGGPWDEVTKSGREIIRHKDVPNDLIKTYFQENMYED